MSHIRKPFKPGGKVNSTKIRLDILEDEYVRLKTTITELMLSVDELKRAMMKRRFE